MTFEVQLSPNDKAQGHKQHIVMAFHACIHYCHAELSETTLADF